MSDYRQGIANLTATNRDGLARRKTMFGEEFAEKFCRSFIVMFDDVAQLG
jgi:hypothetical protein